MKSVIRILMVLLLVALASTQPAVAESRVKAIKRAEKEMRRANFSEAEKIYRRLLEENRDDKEARLGLSFALIKLGKFQESYERAAEVLAADPINGESGFEQHGIIGGDFLSHFRVVLDLRRFQFRITPQTNAISVAAGNK